jgi:hypothetical protein
LHHSVDKAKTKLKVDHIRQFNTNSSDESDADFEIMTVETHDVNIIQSKLFAHMLLKDDKNEVKFQLDSGDTANLIPKSYLSESTEIENSDHTCGNICCIMAVIAHHNVLKLS